MRRTGAGVLAVLSLGAACSAPEPLDEREFVSQANAICREAAGRWDEFDFPPIEDPVSEEEYIEMTVSDMRTGSELGGDVLDQLRDLPPPPAYEERVDRMLDGLGVVVDALDAYAAAYEIRNQAEIERLDREVDDEGVERYQQVARSLGLDDCAKGHFLSAWRAGTAPEASQKPLDVDQPAPVPSSSRSGDGR